jgi:tryptophan synthase beta chain
MTVKYDTNPNKVKRKHNTPDERGYYGYFGGAYIPEMLYPNVEELRSNYLRIIESPDFKRDFELLLRDYVGRPTALYFAQNLSKQFGAKIYLKREDLCHTGAHKLNSVVGQALIAKHLGKKNIIAETGAGQHGVASATVCALLKIPCTVFMGSKDIVRQQPNVLRMKMLGAEVVAVESGSKTLKDATNEAIRYWINHPDDTYYLIGSTIGPHPYPDLVARLQSVISEEIRKQLLEKEGSEHPDYVLACAGGGSNAAGAFFHFIDNGKTRLIGTEAAGEGVDSGLTAATIYSGTPGIIHGCKTLLMQTPDGQVMEAHSISAGLDYPGIGPMHAHLHESGLAEYMPVTDREALDAAQMLSRTEGIIPALETAHAVAALSKLKFNPDDVVVVCLSGRGDKDLQTYQEYFQ